MEEELKWSEMEITWIKNGEEMERKQKWRINGEQTDKNGEEMEQKAKMEREWRKCSVP